MTITKIPQVVLLLFCTALSPVQAASNCPAGGTTIFYGNGVLTTKERADSTLNTLMFAIDHALTAKAPQRDPSCVRYGLAYDSLFVNDQGLVGDAYNVIKQLITAAIQKLLTDDAHAQSDLYQSNLDSPSPPDAWDSAIGSTYVGDFSSFVAANQPDVQKHVSLYTNELTSGNAVLVIAHSQGNLYANQAYNFIGSPPHNQFYTVALATPATNVLGELPPITLDKQLTLSNDLILFIPGAISPGNISNTNTPTRCGSGIGSRFRCHDVINSYLLGNVSGPAIIDAVVSQALKQLTITTTTTSGTESGTVASTPSLIDCGSICSGYIDRGTIVSLTATPDSGAQFMGWSQDCSGTDTTVTVTLSADKTCIATFSRTLTVQKSGNGTGTVTSSPTGINCGASCTLQSAPFNGPVQLTAAADTGSHFNGWGGACSGANVTTTVTITTSNLSCVATFSSSSKLTVTKMGAGSGTVVSVPPGINCGSTCTAFLSGNVQLTASPVVGSIFVDWGGDCSGMSPTTMIDVSGTKSCTATFMTVAVDLNPFGAFNLADNQGPYNVQAVNGVLSAIPAPADISIVVHREVQACGSILFPNDTTVTIPKGQQTVGVPGFVAGRPLGCGSATTVWTVLSASMGGKPLDLSKVPSALLSLAVTR